MARGGKQTSENPSDDEYHAELVEIDIHTEKISYNRTPVASK